MLSRLKRRKIKLTKRKQHRIKTNRKLTNRKLTKRRQMKMKRKRTHRFRKSKKQYGGRFNDEEIEQIKDALRLDKQFTEDEINALVERFHPIAQSTNEQGGFPLFINFLEENDEGVINNWIDEREETIGNEEPQTDNDDSDMEILNDM
jgi:hypothetical protein